MRPLLLVTLLVATDSVFSQERQRPVPKLPTDAEIRILPEEALNWHDQTRKDRERGNLEKAIAAAAKWLSASEKLFGELEEESIEPLEEIAEMQEELEKFPEAKKSRSRLLELRLKRFVEADWRVTDARIALRSLETVAGLSADQRKELREASRAGAKLTAEYENGNSAAALRLGRQVLETRKRLLGELHPDYARSLNDLAVIYDDLGETAKSVPLYRQALEVRQRAVGENHPHYAFSLKNLAKGYQSMGKFDKAEQLYRRALDATKKTWGDAHPGYAGVLDDLAYLHLTMGEPAKAEPLFRQALSITEKTLRESHPLYASSLAGLAAASLDRGDFATAERLFRQVIDIRKKALGESHPLYANSLVGLAAKFELTGEYDKAEPIYRQALDIAKRAEGESHPHYASALSSLAGMYHRAGESAKAEPLCLQAATIVTDHLERAGEGQAEAAQLALAGSLRHYLNSLLLASAGRSPAKVYDTVLRLRGAVTRRQLFTRSVRNADPELKPLVEELQRTCSRMSRLTTLPYDPKRKLDIPAELKTLEEQRQGREAELAAKSNEFAAYRTRKRLTGADLRNLLPEGVVLVEFLQYRTQLCAFVLDREHIHRIDLGEVKPIAQAVDAFRHRIVPDQLRPVEFKGDPRDFLAEKLWAPIQKLIGKPKVVLLSPDGVLCRLPFAALPGSDPSKYLIEEVSLVTIPVPSILPDLLEPRKDKAEPSLVAMGEVDYGKPPPNSERNPITALPATAAEVTEISGTFRAAFPQGRVTELRKSMASEEWLRRAAPNHAYLHLATHGFFAPAGYGQLVGDTDDKRGLSFVSRPEAKPKPTPNPGLLSGLVCAGANDPKELSSEDGILTALEVQDLDLTKTEMVVLSACETGLGNTAGGEGVLGLQRAFHLAGTRTAVTSLWKVDDEATRMLMTRFYDNLFAKKMGRLEALVEAQKWLMKEGPKKGFGDRGMKVVPKEKEERSAERASPYYWAAFVMSGDWR